MLGWAVVGLAGSHAAMVGVMVMTPLHMEHGGADLRIIGIVISVHVLGMFAFSPVVGWLADRLGREPVLGAGGVVLLRLARAVRPLARGQLGRDLRRAVPARPGLVVRHGRRRPR